MAEPQVSYCFEAVSVIKAKERTTQNPGVQAMIHQRKITPQDGRRSITWLDRPAIERTI